MGRSKRSHALCLFLAIPLSTVIRSKAAGAQDAAPLSIETALRTQSFAGGVPIAPSPDGHWLAYTVQDRPLTKPTVIGAIRHTGVSSLALGADVFVMNMGTNETRNLTGSKGDNWLPMWSPDGRYLAFLSDRDDSTYAHPWIWDVKKDELRKVSDINVLAYELEWTPDGTNLLIATLPEKSAHPGSGTVPAAGVDNEKHSSGGVSSSTVIVYGDRGNSPGEAPTGKSDPWNLDADLRDIRRVNVMDGHVTPILSGKRIASYSLSPDGRQIAYTSPVCFEKPGSQQILFDLGIVTLSSLQERVIASHIRLGIDGASFSWSPDSRELSFQTGGMEEKSFDGYVVDTLGGPVRNATKFAVPSALVRKPFPPLWDTEGHIYLLKDGDLWRASIKEENAQKVSAIPGREITQLIPQTRSRLWMLDGGNTTVVLAHDKSGKQDGLYRVELTHGESTALLENGHCYSCTNLTLQFAVTADAQHVVYFAEAASQDEDLWISDAQFRNSRRLTHLNPRFDAQRMGRAQLVRWLADNGEPLQGVLLLPAGYKEGVRYPLLVWVYGGVLLSDHLDRFGLAYRGVFNMQLFATRGYAVLLPDAPLRLGTPMLDLALTVLPGVNKIIEMGIADPDRLGVMGHSYGGYSTLGLIVQTSRFKAAVDIDGMGDLGAAYGEMDSDGTAFDTAIEEAGQGRMGGTPWQFRDRYMENSPIFYLNRTNTPLLIIHGSGDETVAPFLGDEVFVALRRLGKEVEYAKYQGEGHSPLYWSYANQVDVFNRMITWFDTHLKGSEQHDERVRAK